jgi:hypothetical protein
MSTAESRASTAFGRGYRVALTLTDDELAYVYVPASDNSAFAQGHRCGLARRAKLGVGKIASVLAQHLLNEEPITLPAAM